ncbi:hypothetical protein N8865_02885 [Francisellaceae bacterium]|nr:hypothetical protein [Francisellaceae bacterium]
MKNLLTGVIILGCALSVHAETETETETQYHYNGSNQLVQVDKDQSVYRYHYNASGARSAKEDNQGNRLSFYYAEQGGLSNASDGNVTSSYFGGIRYLSNGMAQSQFTDGHNTPKVLSTDADGNSSNTSYTLSPYGKIQLTRHDTAGSVAKSNVMSIEYSPKVYGSGYLDKETGLIYLGARYYNTDLGRFVAQDSYDVTNRYNYAQANPIMMYDPDGHMAKWMKGLLGVGSTILGGIAMATGFGSAPGWGMISMGAGFLSDFMSITSGVEDGSFNFKSWGDGLISGGLILGNLMDLGGLNVVRNSVPTLPIDESILTHEMIATQSNGFKKIGAGTYGTAYQKGNYVYKIMLKDNFYNTMKNKLGTTTLEQRTVTKINDVNKFLKNDFRASLIGEKKDIIKMPLVELNKIRLSNIKETLKRKMFDDAGVVMGDFNSGNVGFYKNQAVVFDMDEVFTMSKKFRQSDYSVSLGNRYYTGNNSDGKKIRTLMEKFDNSNPLENNKRVDLLYFS